jgi:hypothetical protein
MADGTKGATPMRPRVGVFATGLRGVGQVLLGHRVDCGF